MFPTRTLTAAAIAIALLVPLHSARAADDDDVPSAAEAEETLEDLQERLGNLMRAESHARRKVERARQEFEELPGIISEKTSLIERCKTKIREATLELDKLVIDRKASTLRLEKLKAEIATARAKLKAAKNEETIQRDKLELAFRNSESFSNLLAAQAAADDRLKTAKQECLDALAKSPKYASALAEQERADREVKVLRSARPVDSAALSRASQEWMTRKNAISSMERDAIAAIPGMADMQKANDAANRATEDALRTFRIALLKSPEFAPQLEAVVKVQSSITTAVAEQKKTEAVLSKLGTDVADRLQLLTDADSMITTLKKELSDAETRYNNLERDLPRMIKDLEDLEENVERARRAVANARAALNSALERERIRARFPRPATPSPAPNPK